FAVHSGAVDIYLGPGLNKAAAAEALTGGRAVGPRAPGGGIGCHRVVAEGYSPGAYVEPATVPVAGKAARGVIQTARGGVEFDGAAGQCSRAPHNRNSAAVGRTACKVG